MGVVLSKTGLVIYLCQSSTGRRFLDKPPRHNKDPPSEESGSLSGLGLLVASGPGLFAACLVDDKIFEFIDIDVLIGFAEVNYVD